MKDMFAGPALVLQRPVQKQTPSSPRPQGQRFLSSPVPPCHKRTSRLRGHDGINSGRTIL